jgi:hypothetical protein
MMAHLKWHLDRGDTVRGEVHQREVNMTVLFWICWAIALLAFVAWMNPAYAGPAGLICIAAILAALAIKGS